MNQTCQCENTPPVTRNSPTQVKSKAHRHAQRKKHITPNGQAKADPSNAKPRLGRLSSRSLFSVPCIRITTRILFPNDTTTSPML